LRKRLRRSKVMVWATSGKVKLRACEALVKPFTMLRNTRCAGDIPRIAPKHTTT
jgi:hypothetical protein